MRAVTGKGKIYANHAICRKLVLRIGFCFVVFIAGLVTLVMAARQDEAKANWLA